MKISLSEPTAEGEGGPSGQPAEARLVEAARRGDQTAFDALVAMYQTRLCRFTYSLTGNFTQSEELAQEAFITAWTRMSDIREPDRFASWLFGIARNLTRNLRRNVRTSLSFHQMLAATSEGPPAAPTPLEAAINHEEER